MQESYIYLSAFSLMVVICMVVNVATNRNVPQKHRRYFIEVYVLMCITTFCECLWTLINGGNSRILLQITKILEFSITPILPVIYSKTFQIKDDRRNFKNLLFYILVIVHLIIEIVSINTGGYIFYVDENNVYHRGQFYAIYVATFTICATYLFCNIVSFSNYYQNKDVLFLISVILFLFCGILIQFIAKVNVAWLAVSVASLMLFIYHSNVTGYIDSLTTLLNQRSYKSKVESIDEQVIVLLMDVNDFKAINDNYGHSYGDEVLKEIGFAIKETYSKFGYCYRIGGDEFCALLQTTADLNGLNEKFVAKLEELKKRDPRFPGVSIGWALYQAVGDVSILDVIQQADMAMYESKRKSKVQS